MAGTISAPRFRARYNEEIRAALKDELGLANLMMVPKLEKIVLNMGVARQSVPPSCLNPHLKT